MYRLFIYIFISSTLISCAGYKARNRSNPFVEQGIKSIAIPTFVNRTAINGLTPLITREAIETFSNFHGLQVNSGKLTHEDAIVIGVITPTGDVNKEVVFTNSTLMNTEQQEAIGNRNAFYVPTIGSFSANIKLIILKKPSKEEIEFFTSYFKLSKNSFPRTVFHKTFILSGSFSVENNVGDSGLVRGTKNSGNLRKALEGSSQAFDIELKEVMANAF